MPHVNDFAPDVWCNNAFVCQIFQWLHWDMFFSRFRTAPGMREKRRHEEDFIAPKMKAIRGSDAHVAT